MMQTSSNNKLELLLERLDSPGAVESDEVWEAGLKTVWNGLVNGKPLRKHLPLSIVVSI